MEVRPFRPEDKEKLRKLYRELYGDFQNSIFPEELRKFEEYADLEASIDWLLKQEEKKEKWRTFIADENGMLVGFATGRIGKFHQYKLSQYGEIVNFYLQKPYRYQGIGKQLLTALENWFREKDCQVARIETWTFNKETIEIYKKMGFKEISLMFVKEL